MALKGNDCAISMSFI